MIESHIRQKLQPYFNQFGLLLSAISPNQITATAFGLGILSALLICLNHLWLAVFCLFLSGLCDVLDGTVARLIEQSQPVGAYIDLISDRMVESAIILGFTFTYPQHYFAYILFLISVLFHFSTFIAAGALFANTGQKSMHHEHSMIERAEAFIVFALMMLFTQYIFELLTLFSVAIIADGLNRFNSVIKGSIDQ